MKWLLALVFLVLLIDAAPAPNDQNPRIRRLKKHRRMGADLRAFHAEQRKSHRNYVPYYPREPPTDVVKIGTPWQEYELSQETGIESIWLLDSSYPNRSPHFLNHSYDPSASNSSRYVGNYTGYTGDFEVTGDKYEDVLEIDPHFVGVQRFGVIKASHDKQHDNPTQLPTGVLGYGWNPAEKDSPGPDSAYILNLFTKWPKMDRYYIMAVKMYSVPYWFTVIGIPLSSEVCESHFTWAPLTYNQQFHTLEFQIDTFTFGDTRFAGGVAKFDTGLPTLNLPHDTWNQVFTVIKPDFDYDYGLWTTSCKQTGQLPDFVYKIGGHDFVVPSLTYVVDLDLGDGKCAVAFEFSDGISPPFVLGTPFLWQYCVKMDIDNTQIGFSKCNTTSSLG